MTSIGEQLQALSEASGGQMGQGSVFSLTLATVKSISDDKNLNRVKCLPIDAVSDNELTDWCYVMAPMGGNDPHSPIVLGSYWNSETTAPVAVKDGKAEDYRLKTPKKVDLSIHDEDKKQKITVTMPSGIVLEIDDEKQTVNTKSKDGKTSLLMKMKDGEVELQASSKITLKAGQASVILEKNGKITVKGSDAVTVQGKSVTAKAQGKTAVQGMDVEVKANKDLNMSATANASLKGMLLKLN